MKHFLKFELIDQTPKTNSYLVTNIKDEELGVIAWYPRWRQYIFAPIDILMSRECTRQLADFLDKIQIEQKEKKHGVDNK